MKLFSWLRRGSNKQDDGKTSTVAAEPFLKQTQAEEVEAVQEVAETKPQTPEILMQVLPFREWQAIFLDCHQRDVAGLAMFAMEHPTPAGVEIHFWNAVINHMISAAFLQPGLTDYQREATLSMVGSFQDYVRARWKHKPDLMDLTEKAWQSTMQFREFQDTRDEMFAQGHINHAGQFI